MPRWVSAVVLVVFASAPAQGAEPASLARARTLYNEGNYDAAIEAAGEAVKGSIATDAASLVLARAHLERYRQRADLSDLTTAREILNHVRQQALAPRDRVDLLIGLGQLLFLGEAYGAAAELFDNALAQSGPPTSRTRTLLLDWWASALDREAQSRASDKRLPVFERMVERMENELRTDPGSAPASYWLAVGARGTGDLDRAWDSAIAGWVRASLNPDTTSSLRADLDRLVTQALVTERARQRPIPGRDASETAAALQGEWDLVKTQWP
jgi:tetratricopeptide (TPR) repeat protein